MKRRKRLLLFIPILLAVASFSWWWLALPEFTQSDVSTKLAIGMTPAEVEVALGWSPGRLKVFHLTSGASFATLLRGTQPGLILPQAQIYLVFNRERLTHASWVVQNGFDELDRKTIPLRDAKKDNIQEPRPEVKPPYTFMADATLWYVEPTLKGETYDISYLSNRDCFELAKEAAKELGLPYDDEEYNRPHGWSIIRHRSVVGSFRFAHTGDWRSQTKFPPIPPAYQTLITIRRKPSHFDIASAVEFARKWKGSRGGSL